MIGMWEHIRANRRRSILLFTSMGVVLCLLGGAAGWAVTGYAQGALGGVIVALVIFFILNLVSRASGSSILLATSGAKEVTPDVHPRLHNVVEEMSLAAGLPMPKVYIMNEEAPNAFATGIRAENSAIAVTAGLLARLNRDELQGVVAHEMSHIANRDVSYMTYAGVALGAITLISHFFLRSMWYTGGSRRYRSSDSGGGQAQIIIIVITLLLAILGPILAQLLYFAISRRREYLADASAARLTRYPEGLASALEKIAASTEELKAANRVTAPMFIINPLKRKGMAASDLTSTHPPISRRIAVLRAMTHGASFTDYEQAFEQVTGGSSSGLPGQALVQDQAVAQRAASSEQAPAQERGSETRAVNDIFLSANHYAFVPCSCGVKIKIPPDFPKPRFACPRCGKEHQTPPSQFRFK
jgi:heat shock protein HtpX